MQIKTIKDFSKLIHTARIKANLTQAQLAAASGTGERFIRELEKGKTTCQMGKALFVLSIRLHGEPVGVLEQTSTGKKSLRLLPTLAEAVVKV